MSRAHLLALAAFLLAALNAPELQAASQRRVEAASVSTRVVAKGFKMPVGVKFDPSNAAHVIEQRGLVKAVEGEKTRVFLDLSGKVTRFLGPSERGLLDIAFHPDYPKNGRLFAHYTDRKGNTVLSEFRAKEGKADAASEKMLLTQKQPYSNHNGGQIEFGPDGTLYMALGDGGSAGDPKNRAQNLQTLLGKILRLDVSGGGAYSIPKSNPFAESAKKPSASKGAKSAQTARPEIWAYGLRNPWRFSFDGPFLYIADVGQSRWEELNAEDLREGGGKNYGWKILEGLECFEAESCGRKDIHLPVHVYRLYEKGDCSVTGGYVYRGKAIAELQGLYFYSDYCSGTLRSFRYEKGSASDHREWNDLNPDKANWGRVSSLGRDNEGELYIVSYDRGTLLKLVPSPEKT